MLFFAGFAALREISGCISGDAQRPYLSEFDYGQVSAAEDGRTLREYTITVINKEVEVVPGIVFRPGLTTAASPAPRCAAPKATCCAST